MKKSEKNELVCPFCGGPVEHTVKSTKKCIDGVWEDIKEKHMFECPKCHTGEFKMGSVEEFQEYCAWRDKLVNHFIIVVDDSGYPSIHIGAVFKDEDDTYGRYHNLHPEFPSGCRMPYPRHMGKVFFPDQREEAFALYQKLVKEHLDSLEKDRAHKLHGLLGTYAKEEYPDFWKEGMTLLYRLEQYVLEKSFAKFLRFLHEYDELVEDYPDEKDQMEHLFLYPSWLYRRNADIHQCASPDGMKLYIPQEEKLLKEFKKTHK